jgi:hypothetical protein
LFTKPVYLGFPFQSKILGDRSRKVNGDELSHTGEEDDVIGQKDQVVIGFRVSGVIWFGGIDIARYLEEGSEWVLVA